MLAWLLAQDPTATSFDFTVYGVSGTTIAILLYGISRLWADNRDLRHELSEVQGTSLEKVTAIATTASIQITEGAKALEAATIMMHQFAGRPTLAPEQLYEVSVLLRELKDRRP